VTSIIDKRLQQHKHKCFRGCFNAYWIRGKGRRMHGHAVAQAECRRLPTMAAWVRAQVRSCGVCRGQSDTSVSYANHSTDCSTLITIHHYLGLVQ
jgi:hypothetical protein